jgi:enamine deaminase RidA (YjgF/YER057c/UK114 family)
MRKGSGANLSRSVEYQGVVHVCGLTAEDKSADMAGQTAQVLARIDKALAEAGTDKQRLLTAMVYISDMAKKDDMNHVWQGWIDRANPPTRATIGCDLGSPDTLVEIVVSAAKR